MNGLVDVLVALQSLSVSPGGEITRRDFHIAVLKEIAGWSDTELQNATDNDIRDAYIATLEAKGIKFIHLDREAPSTEEAGIFWYPLFPTETRFVPYHKETSDRQLKQRLKEIYDVLTKMGFLSSYKAIYVTDDLARLRGELGMPDFDVLSLGAPTVGSSFDYFEGSPHPILMMEVTPVPIPLHYCLLHEITHLLIHYAWDLQKIYDQKDLRRILAARLLAETYAHLLPTTVLGAQYLLSSIIVAAVQGRAYPSGEQSIRETAPTEEARQFLALFPWVAAARARAATTKGAGDTLLETIANQAWSPRLKNLAESLQPIINNVYKTGNIEKDLDEVSRLLGTSGPCGILFHLHLLQRWMEQNGDDFYAL